LKKDNERGGQGTQKSQGRGSRDGWGEKKGKFQLPVLCWGRAVTGGKGKACVQRKDRGNRTFQGKKWGDSWGG